MTEVPGLDAPPPRLRRPPPRRRRRAVALGAVASIVCFAAGIAVGQALEEGSAGDASVTLERTIVPTAAGLPPATSTTTTSTR